MVEDASADLERADDMTMAMLLVLERLTPRERAAYILREAFDYDHAEIRRRLEGVARFLSPAGEPSGAAAAR